jgi:hypothetical protein
VEAYRVVRYQGPTFLQTIDSQTAGTLSVLRAGRNIFPRKIFLLLISEAESANELYRLSDRRLSGKLVPTFADRVCHMVSVTDP